MHIERERVMKLLRDIDPEGVESREKKDFEGESTMQKDPTTFGIQMAMINLSHMVSVYTDVLMASRED